MESPTVDTRMTINIHTGWMEYPAYDNNSGTEFVIQLNAPAPYDFSAHTVDELKSILNTAGIEYQSGALKAELVELTEQHYVNISL